MRLLLTSIISLVFLSQVNAQTMSAKELNASLRVNSETTRILNELTKLAEGGDAEAAIFASNAYRSGLGAKRDLESALKYARMAADAGSVPAIRISGDLTRDLGKRSEVAITEAVKFYAEAAEKGDLASFARLSEYQPGSDVKMFQEALKAKGYYASKIDGIAGPLTIKAFSEFCAKEKIVKPCKSGISSPQAIRAAVRKGIFAEK